MSVRVGIIGTGGIADDCHAPAVNLVDGALLAGVLSREEKTARTFLERHNAPSGKVHTSLASFVADQDIDCAIIASPDRLHTKHALACLNAGKDVLLEKPMATSLKEAASLLNAAQANNCILAIGFHLRSHNGHRALYDSIEKDNSIGTLRHIRAVWAFPQKDASNWRACSELGKWWSLAAVGAHCIDLARWYARDMDEWYKFSSVIGRQVWQGPHDETAVISAQLASGPTVEIVSSVQFGPFDRLELHGDKGQAICEGTFGRKGAGIIFLNGQKIIFEQESPFVRQIRQFIDCINTRREPITSGLIGTRNVRDLLLACDI